MIFDLDQLRQALARSVAAALNVIKIVLGNLSSARHRPMRLSLPVPDVSTY